MPLELDGAEWERVVGTLRAAGCVFAEAEADLLCEGAEDIASLDAMIARRVEGTPLELVLGWAEFRGLRLVVESGVFVPRRRTAFLAYLAEGFLASGDIVVDLCCGAGAIGAALLDSMRRRDSGSTGNSGDSGRSTGSSNGSSDGSSDGRTGSFEIELHAADVSESAIRCARKNLASVADTDPDRYRAHVYQGDLDAPLPPRIAGKVGILTANVPYVPSAEIPLLPSEARDYEPHTALDGGADGLDILRRVAQAAPRWLRPGGRLLIEISDRQQPAAVAAFRAAGLEPSVHESDDYYTTVLIGRFPRG